MMSKESGSAVIAPRAALFSLVVVAATLLPAGQAMALWDDRLEVFGSLRVTDDDNVFRDRARISDTIFTTSIGLNLDVPVSRQRFLLGGALHENRYDNNKALNFTGKEARGIWVWQIGDRLSGRLGHAQAETLGNFSNLTGSRVPNLIKSRQEFLEARYMLTPRWRLQGAYTDSTQRNSDGARVVNDLDAEALEAGVSYITPAGNSLGVAVRNEDGRLPNRQFVAGSFIDNAYTQESVGVNGEWIISPQSRLNGRLDRVQREYAQVPQRNFEGATYRAVYDWTPGGRFSMNAVAQRDISATEEIRTSLVLVKGVQIRPNYSITEKTSLSGLIEFATREFLADPGVILGVTGGRTDKVRVLGVTLTWRPLRTVQVLGTYQHENRSSSFAGADYTVNLLSLMGRLAF